MSPPAPQTPARPVQPRRPLAATVLAGWLTGCACIHPAGWYRAHVALRADLTAMAGMLESFTKQVDGGKAITREQAAAADKYVTTTMKFLHHHHANEDGKQAGPADSQC